MRGAFGQLLFQKFLDEMLAKGVRGAFGEAIAENVRIRRFAASWGYHEIGKPYPLPGMRDANGKRLHGIAVVRDLTVPFERRPREPAEKRQSTANTVGE
mgnify:CR=1 FL=1